MRPNRPTFQRARTRKLRILTFSYYQFLLYCYELARYAVKDAAKMGVILKGVRPGFNGTSMPRNYRHNDEHHGHPPPNLPKPWNRKRNGRK